MALRRLEPGETAGAARGEVIVCIPVYGGHEHFVACLASVLAHTPAGVRVLICDDASPDRRTPEHVRKLAGGAEGRELLYLRREQNAGFPANVNGGLAAAAPADVVVLNSDCEVADGWLDGLRAAAYESPRVATATPLTNHGTIVSVPELRRPGPVPPAPWTLDRAAAAVARRSLRIRPRLPTAIGHCMYLRRSALDLVGDLDLAFSPGYGEEVDFSQRCLRHGLVHVLADEVLVVHHGGASFAATPERLAIQGAHEQLIAERYPRYHDGLRALERPGDGPLSQALGVARRALLGTAVTLDLRGAPSGGEHDAALLALLRALSEAGGVGAESGVDGASRGEPRRLRLGALVPGPLRPGLAPAAGIAGLTLFDDAAQARAWGADVLHRIYPAGGRGEVGDATGPGSRMIVTQADLCAFANPEQFPDFAAWEAHRVRTREVMAGSDAVMFLSASTRAEAIAEGLLTPERAAAIKLGVDHLTGAATGTETSTGAPRPGPAPQTGDGVTTIVCLADTAAAGNRMFVLAMVSELQKRHAWGGRLVLAGRAVAHSSSAAEEQQYLAERPALAAVTTIIAAPDPAQRDRLLADAALVIDPVLCGAQDPMLAPAFAGAAHGVPCLLAPGVLDGCSAEDPATTLVAWDAKASAERALALLSDPELRRRNLELISHAARSRTWRATAEALLGLYDRVSAMPVLSPVRSGRPADAVSAAAEAYDHAVPVNIFEDRIWQMSLGERAAVEGVLAQLRPSLAIEIGSAEGSCLQRIAAHAHSVHSFDLTAPSLPVAENVCLHTGDSHELLPRFLAELTAQERNVDFVIVDGDHSPEGVRRDLEDLLDSPALARTVILIHDTANPRVRSGLDAVRFAAWPKVAHVELDWIPGRLFAEPELRNELWYGLGLVLLNSARPAYLNGDVYEQRYHPAGELLAELRDLVAARELAPGGLAERDDLGRLRRRVVELTAELARERLRDRNLDALITAPVGATPVGVRARQILRRVEQRPGGTQAVAAVRRAARSPIGRVARRRAYGAQQRLRGAARALRRTSA